MDPLNQLAREPKLVRTQKNLKDPGRPRLLAKQMEDGRQEILPLL